MLFRSVLEAQRGLSGQVYVCNIVHREATVLSQLVPSKLLSFIFHLILICYKRSLIFSVNLMIFESFKGEGNRVKGKTIGELKGSTGSKEKKMKQKKDNNGTNTPESGAETPHKEKSKASPEEVSGDNIFVTPKTANDDVISDTIFYYPEVEKFFREVIPRTFCFSQKGENESEVEFRQKELLRLK